MIGAGRRNQRRPVFDRGTAQAERRLVDRDMDRHKQSKLKRGDNNGDDF